MKYFFFIVFSLTTLLKSHAQHEDTQWIFNSSGHDYNEDENSFWAPTVLDFNTLPVRFYRNNDIILDLNWTNTSICNPQGQLYLYSNGMSIHGQYDSIINTVHGPILNGEKVNYGDKWELLVWPDFEFTISESIGFRRVNNALLLPIPEQSDQWLHLSHNYENRESGLDWPDTDFFELKKCIIEVNENDELEVTEKDVTINDRILKNGCLTATKHANGRDWWFLQFNKDTVYTYLVDPHGVKLSHLQFLPFPIYDSGGQAKFNQEGTVFAFHGSTGWTETDKNLFFITDFDRCSGNLTTPVIFEYRPDNFSSSTNGLEFSPSGNFLYLNDKDNLFQLDLRDEDFFENRLLIMSWDSTKCDDGFSQSFDRKFGILKLGLDGKIYQSGNHQCFYLDVIHQPDKEGIECMAEQRAIRLPTYHFGTMPTHVAYRLGPLDGSPCDTLGLDNNPVSRFWYEQDSSNHQEIQFRDVSYYRPEEWSWTFGDGNTSDEMSPLHTYASNGVYEVCLTVSNENSSNSSCQELQIGPVANQNIQREYDINIFPNPVEDVTRLVFTEYLPEEARIVLYDASGLKVFADRVYQECMIDLSGLGAGIYLYEILDGIEFLSSGKIIKI